MSNLSPASKDILAGTSAGIVSVLVCHPLDTIRVRLQTAPAGRFTGVTDVVKQTIKGEGVTALYKGITSPLTAQGIQKATMFFSFGAAKRYLTDASSGPLPLWKLYLCGSVAGMSNALVANPFELVRNRLQVQYQRNIASSQYKGPFDCARQMVATSGVRSLWLGLGPMILRDAPGVGAWYCTFEGVRRYLVPAGEDPSITPKWKILVSGACAGVGFWVFAFPQDTIKNIIQTRGMSMQIEAATAAAATAAAATASASSSATHTLSHSILLTQQQQSLGFFATGAELVRKEGIRRLWKGFTIAAARGIPGASSTFLTYQLAINWINKH